MTVRELIEVLRQAPPDSVVILSSDGEGNRYSPLHQCDQAAYRPGTIGSGDVGLLKLTPEDEDQGYGDEDVLVDGQPALVLYPTA